MDRFRFNLKKNNHILVSSTLETILLAFLLWLWICHNLFSGMKLKNHNICWQLPALFSMYLVVVEEVHEDLHDAREDQHAGAGDQEGDDVVK